MATHLSLLTCLTVLACLLQTTVSDHKKKIIVKVPTLIKHIHHDIYKPVHVHKVHAKKVEHHHHSFEEEKLPWKHGKRDKISKPTTHGSYSNFRPVLANKEIDAHADYPSDHVQGRPYSDEEYRFGHGDNHDYSQEDSFNSDSGEQRLKVISRNPHEERSKWEPIDLSGEEWLISGEDLRDLRDDFGFAKEGKNSGKIQKRKKHRPMNWDTEHVHSQPDDSGWKPIMNFNGWKDVEDIHKQNPSEYNKNKYINSGEYPFEGSKEETYYPIRNNNGRKRTQQRKNKDDVKRPKWSKQIEVREPSSEEYYSRNYESTPQTQTLQPNRLNNEVEKPNNVLLQVAPPQIVQTIVKAQEVQGQPYQSQIQYTTWPHQEQKSYPTSHPQIPQPQQQVPKWHATQQSTPSPWQHPRQQPQPTEPSSVVWSGHHLQMPQHSVWHVQRHSVKTPPVQIISASTSPPPTPPPLPANSIPTFQLHQQPTQMKQASVPIQHYVSPDWPGPQATTGVKQHWEQSVLMGGNGPASSYKVEVINYAGQENHQG